MSEVNEKTPLLEVRNLRKLFAGKSSFFQKDKSWIKAVDDVSFLSLIHISEPTRP